jgi:hypothetical protein
MRSVTAEEAMVSAMSADPVRDGEHPHGLMDPYAVAQGLRVAVHAVSSQTELVVTAQETVAPLELSFAQVAMSATRWTRA